MQGLVAILRDSLGVSTEAEQQAHAGCTGCCASLVQGSLAPWCEVDSSPPEQQELQAVCVAPAGCDVQRRGELLLIGQGPQSCREREFREPCPATAHKSTGPRPALPWGTRCTSPLERRWFPPRGRPLPCQPLLRKVSAFGVWGWLRLHSPADRELEGAGALGQRLFPENVLFTCSSVVEHRVSVDRSTAGEGPKEHGQG